MKKLLTMGLVIATMSWTLGLMGMVTVPVANAAAAGDLIKTPNNPAVYYLGADNKRYVFPTFNTYKTWFGTDFSTVKTISLTEMGNINMGGNVPYRAGTRLIKLSNDPKTYAVEPNGVIRHIPTEAVASDLYGSLWYKLVDVLDDSFFASAYTYGSALTTLYPSGSLVKESGGSTIYYINGTEKRPVASEAAFLANNFQWDNIRTHSLADYSVGTSITGAESDITTVAGGSSSGVPESVSTGTLTVSLASDTPAAATVVKNATRVKFTKLNFTATGGDVTIDTMTIQRYGLAQDSNFANVYILAAADESMVGNEKTLGSAHTAVVNDDITIANGTTKSYYIAATMHTTLQAGEVAGLGLSAITVKGSASVSASLPVTGNSMTMNNTISIGTVTPADGGSATSATKPVGTTNYVFASLKLTANSTEDVQVEKIRFYQQGTAADADVANLKLVVDGNVLATVAKATDKAVVFDLSGSPFSITKGNNKIFELKGDIVSGSARTIDFEVYNKADLSVKGKTYGFYINPAYTNTSAPYWSNDYPTTVDHGTLVVSKAVGSVSNIAEGASQQELGKFSFNVQGEPIIITQLVMELTTSSSSGVVTNVTVYDKDGNVVAGPVDPTTGSDPDTITLTDTFTIPVGILSYTVKGDLDSNFAANDTIRLDINTPATKITAKGEVTNSTVTASPASEITGDTMTVKTASLTVSTSASPAAQTVAAGTNDYTFSNFVLDATQSGEDVKVTQLKVKHTTSAANLHNYITGITLYEGSNPLNQGQSGESSTSVSTATSTIVLTNPLIIPKGTSKTLTLKADISGSAAADSTHQFGLVGTDCLTAYGNSTGNSITPSRTNSDGQRMTIIAGGTLKMARTGSPSDAGLIIGDTTNTLGQFNFEAQYENIEVQKIGVTITATSTASVLNSTSLNAYKNVKMLELYDGSTKLGEVEVTGKNATITPSSLIIPMGSSSIKKLTVKALTNPVGQDQPRETSGTPVTVAITGVEAKGVSTGSVTGITKTGLDTSVTYPQYVYKTLPTVTKVALSGMGNGDQELYKFTVEANSKGEVGLAKVSFAVSTTTATVTDFMFYEGTKLLTNTALSNNFEGITDGSDGKGGKFVVNVTFTTSVGIGKELTSIGAGETKTYTLKGTVANWVSTSGLQVQMLADNAIPTVSTFDTVDTAASDNFIWSDCFIGQATETATNSFMWTNSYKLFATSTQSF